jgi:hypothetical protein
LVIKNVCNNDVCTLSNIKLINIMKRFTSISVTLVLALFVASLTLSGAPKTKKQLGIATYSVKGLESDIEGSFKALADAG